MRARGRTRRAQSSTWLRAAAGCWSCKLQVGVSLGGVLGRDGRALGEGCWTYAGRLAAAALMRDQISAAAQAGLRAATVNSTNVEEWGEVLATLRSGQTEVLLISPEQLSNLVRRPAAGATRPVRTAGH
jgi:hypothetical protein